jgi:uncharacterized protein (DUF302 family)
MLVKLSTDRLSTDKTVSETAVALKSAIQANNFGVMQVYSLRETTPKNDVEIAAECLIFEVCQLRVFSALSCRISIYEEDGKTMLATLKPTTLQAVFQAPQLDGAAPEVEATIVKIMRQAASG